MEITVKVRELPNWWNIFSSTITIFLVCCIWNLLFLGKKAILIIFIGAACGAAGYISMQLINLRRKYPVNLILEEGIEPSSIIGVIIESNQKQWKIVEISAN